MQTEAVREPPDLQGGRWLCEIQSSFVRFGLVGLGDNIQGGKGCLPLVLLRWWLSSGFPKGALRGECGLRNKHATLRSKGIN